MKGENTMTTYMLNPCDSRKSFYGKAMVIIDGGCIYLKSYETIVCMIDAEGVFHKLWGDYSQTTMRHINSFRYENRLCKIGKSDWNNMIEG